MRNHYWTCSRFADWLRGTMKPGAETSEGWRSWRRQAQRDHPIRYWLAEEGLDLIQKIVYFVPDRLYSIKYYINNRWVTRTHCLTAHPRDLPRGEWRDLGDRILPCLFNELVDYVEVELAWWHIAWSDKAEREKYQAPFWATGWFRWRTWRNARAGLDNLDWQTNLTNKDWVAEDHPDYGKPSPQAENAREILALYKWWTEERPQRPDPHDVSGWSDYCEKRRAQGRGLLDDDDELDDMLEPDTKIDTKPMLDKINQMEAAYEQEDEEMMIRLIKIRRSLWT